MQRGATLVRVPLLLLDDDYNAIALAVLIHVGPSRDNQQFR
jgi:hypothetical protein